MQPTKLYQGFLISVIFFFVLTSCGSTVDSGEDYGDILDSPSGLILTEDEHIYGWGRSDCLACHNLNNIHLEDRSDIGVDVDTIREGTFEDGEEGCSTCHGDNGT